MTRITFIGLSLFYFAVLLFFGVLLYDEGHANLVLAICVMATLAWTCVKIKLDDEGYKKPTRKRKPETF